MSDTLERTFIMINPDGVQRGCIGKIFERMETRGLKLIALKFTWASEDLLKKHYAEHTAKPFFSTLIDSSLSGPVVMMVWEGLNVVKMGRFLLGATDPKDSHPGTVRGNLSIQVGCKNIIHGSDSVESAKKEIKLWFQPEELITWTPAYEAWL